MIGVLEGAEPAMTQTWSRGLTATPTGCRPTVLRKGYSRPVRYFRLLLKRVLGISKETTMEKV